MEKAINQFKNFEYGKKLSYWNNNKVLLASFIPQGQDNEVRFFRKKPDNWLELLNTSNLKEVVNDKSISEFVKDNGVALEGFAVHQQVGKHLGRIPSRTVLSEIREPFEVEPWNQCLIDSAIKYGSMIDDDKEQYLFEQKSGEDILMETKLSLAKVLQNTSLVWTGRSQMVCHPEGLVYGEIDEIWYDQQSNKFVVGDTKTSSSVNKIGYWYQLGVYIEILKQLNPELKDDISNTAVIQWIRIQNDKWSIRSDFADKDENGEFKNYAKRYEYSKWILDNAEGKRPETLEKAKKNVTEIEYEISKYKGKGNQPLPTDEVYWMKWNKEKVMRDEPDFKNELISKDLETEGVLSLVRDDINFISKYNIKTVEDFKTLVETNAEAKQENDSLQQRYNVLKQKYEAEKN